MQSAPSRPVQTGNRYIPILHLNFQHDLVRSFWQMDSFIPGILGLPEPQKFQQLLKNTVHSKTWEWKSFHKHQQYVCPQVASQPVKSHTGFTRSPGLFSGRGSGGGRQISGPGCFGLCSNHLVPSADDLPQPPLPA